MKTNLRCITGAALLLLTAVAAWAQESPYAQLKAYDYQNRKASSAIYQLIREAGGDKAKTAAIETGLVGVLKDPASTEAAKMEACRLLWIVGSAQSVPVLAGMLADEKLGNYARYALERNPDPSAAAALRGALKAAQGPALVGVIDSIGDRGDVLAVPGLRGLCKSADPLVREAAIAALGKLGTPSALGVLQGLPVGDPAVNRALVRCADELPAGQRPLAVRLYTSLAEEGRPAATRVAALRALVRLAAPKAGGTVLGALMSADPAVRIGAARIAAGITNPQVTRGALAQWHTLPQPAQIVLLTGWADRHEPLAAEVALQAAKSEDPDLRLAGVQTAARVGGPKVVPALAALAASGEPSTSQAARMCLASMPGVPTEQAILDAAQQGQPDERAALLAVLAERRTPAAVGVLVKTAEGSDTRLAADALRALQQAGGAQEYPAIVKVFVTTADEGVRDRARDAVVAVAQRMGDQAGAAAPLLAASASASGAAKAAIISALAEIGGDSALDEVTKAAKSSDAQVKQAAVTALADTWSDAKAMPALLQIAQADADRSTRVIALRGYLRLLAAADPSPAPEKVAKVKTALGVAARPEEKRQALGVLRDCRTPEAVALAASCLNDPELFSDAADTVLYLASAQRRDNRNLAAVTGPATTAALDTVIAKATDDSLKARAQKAKGS